jgi:hypothetical protein
MRECYQSNFKEAFGVEMDHGGVDSDANLAARWAGCGFLAGNRQHGSSNGPRQPFQ